MDTVPISQSPLSGADFPICCVGVAATVRKNAVEPYSAALEYAVVVALAVGILSYARDLKVHKEFFGGGHLSLCLCHKWRQEFSNR